MAWPAIEVARQRCSPNQSNLQESMKVSDRAATLGKDFFCGLRCNKKKKITEVLNSPEPRIIPARGLRTSG